MRKLYPVWFPSPSCWIKAVKTAIPTFWGGAVVGLLEVWRFGFLSVLTKSPEPIFMAVVLVLISLLWYFFLIIAYHLFLKLLWSNPPQWIKPAKRRDVLLGFIVMAVSTCFAATLTISPGPLFSKMLVAETLQRSSNPERAFLPLFGFWFLAAAYLYHAAAMLQTRVKPH